MLSAVMFGCSFNALAEQPKIDPGLWQMTMKATMAGMGEMPARTQNMCFTAEDLSGGPIPSTDENCQILEQNVSGNKATWKMRCSGQVAMEGSGTTTFSRTAYTSVINMSGSFNGQQMNMTQHVDAKRVGDCTESSIPRS